MKNNLRELRIRHGYTQAELAKLMGLKCEDRISHWEKGLAYPSVVNALKLARLLNVSVEVLYPHPNIIETIS